MNRTVQWCWFSNNPWKLAGRNLEDLLIVKFSSFQLLKLEELSESRFLCAHASPCPAAFVYHSRALFKSLVTPSPSS